MAWLLTRSITGPLREAVIAAEFVAAGDLTQTIGIVGKDEVTRLFQALESMLVSREHADSTLQLAKGVGRR